MAVAMATRTSFVNEILRPLRDIRLNTFTWFYELPSPSPPLTLRLKSFSPIRVSGLKALRTFSGGECGKDRPADEKPIDQ
eukprot:964468-Prorocentrum_minimum.AAC.1